MATTVAQLELASQNYWLIWSGALVFSMQAGFSMLEVGSVRAKNTKSILVKNIMDACICAVFYWGFGYGLQFGSASSNTDQNVSRYIGNAGFFYTEKRYEMDAAGSENFSGYAHMFFNYAFAAVCVSIVSGTIAERSTMKAYWIYSAFMAAVIFPVAAHWIWSKEGWASPIRSFGKNDTNKFLDTGAIDFAGSGVVHMLGGLSAYIAACWLGPRYGRFDEDGQPCPMPAHSPTMQVLGTMSIWVGWYGANVGTVFTYGYYSYYFTAGRIAMCTTLSAACASITAMIWSQMRSKAYNLNAICNGAVAGLVSISAGCATVAPWGAAVTGLVGGVVYQMGSSLDLILLIDDVADAVAVHGWCGLWGMLACGLFSRTTEVQEVYGYTNGGAFYGWGNIFCANCVLTLLIIVWTVVTMNLLFGFLYYTSRLRITKKEEIDGIDGNEFESDDDSDIEEQEMDEIDKRL